MSLFLNVPYTEKEEAKSLGAKWNPIVKKWYIDLYPNNYINFSKWLLKNCDEAIIVNDYLYIIEGYQQCWKCKKQTKVIGLGIGEYTHLYNTDEGPQYEIIEDLIIPSEEIHLAWVNDEDEIPPKLLKYLKSNYSLKRDKSKCSFGNFANHCDFCGALQKNYFLFEEPSSPLSSCTTGTALIQRMKNLKIYGIPIEDDLQLNWEIQFCSNDFAYLKYGNYKELVLCNNIDDYYISYQELYEI